jgi:hypothetical protein
MKKRFQERYLQILRVVIFAWLSPVCFWVHQAQRNKESRNGKAISHH